MSFSGDIDKFIKKTSNKIELAVKRTSFILFSKIVALTPVDTGRARGNWVVSLNSIDRTTSDITSTLSSAIQNNELNRFKLNDTVYITNSLPYIMALENGSSKQAPGGMVKLTVLEFKQTLLQVLNTIK